MARGGLNIAEKIFPEIVRDEIRNEVSP
jgi:hypothetical protein